MIRFHNFGELDLLALRTFGLHAKESSSAIGQFGTGLKYALAVLMRNGCDVSIRAGAIELEITTEQRNFRGKNLDFVVAQPKGQAPIVTGKHRSHSS